MLINKIKNFFTSEFVINVSTLMSGTVISQIIPFLIAPIISRLYFPEDYALVAVYNSITVLLTIVATGMYSSALMIDKTDQEAINTASAAFLVTTSITIVSVLIFLLFNKTIAKLTKNDNINIWLYLIPLTVFSTGGYQTLNMWNNRLKRYKRIATNRVIQTIVTSGSTLIFGFLSYHSTGLMVSLLLGQIFSFMLLFYQTFFDDKDLYKEISFEKIKSSFVRHCDFPKYNMPQGFLDGIRESSIIWIISNFFGPFILGSYSFATNMLNKPLQTIGEAYRQVFFQKVSSLYNENKDFWTFTKKNIFLLFLLFPFFLLILIWGSKIFNILFGNNWNTAGYIAQIICLWLFLRFFTSPLSSIPLILNQQKTFFYFGLINNISLPLILFLVTIISREYIVSFIAFTIIGVINLLFINYWIYKISSIGKIS
ncbi:MAG: oligosaccharide flippase family protein [Candidatus Woesearchaeota archaeon]